MFSAIFFDLDGTLVDTALDFQRAINSLLAASGRDNIELQPVREQVSNGARALTTLAFGLSPGDNGFDSHLKQLLDAYDEAISNQSQLFIGMDKVLNLLDEQQIPWGVVTNKPSRFTNPIMTTLDLDHRSIATICPDHVMQRKPDPEGLLIAADSAGVAAENCLYVGDHQRDIEAGKNAAMATACALYGYIGEHEMPEEWQADYPLYTPTDLLPLIRKPNGC